MSEKRVLDMPAETDKKPKMTSEEKIEAGKIELMKVVEGVQGAEKLAELLDKGKKKGKLSSGELMDVLEEMDLRHHGKYGHRHRGRGLSSRIGG